MRDIISSYWLQSNSGGSLPSFADTPPLSISRPQDKYLSILPFNQVSCLNAETWQALGTTGLEEESKQMTTRQWCFLNLEINIMPHISHSQCVCAPTLKFLDQIKQGDREVSLFEGKVHSQFLPLRGILFILLSVKIPTSLRCTPSDNNTLFLCEFYTVPLSLSS